MTIASEITRINNNIASAYTACNGKGATMPATQNSANLATCIDSIQTGGGTPTLDSITITPTTSPQSISPPSGVDGYNLITVNAVTSSIDSDIVASNIKSGVSILGVTGTYVGDAGNLNYIPREVVNGVYKAPVTSFTFNLPSGVTSIGAYMLYYAFANSTGLTGIDLSSITTLNEDYALTNACYNCTNLTGSLDLSNLTSITGVSALRYVCYGCTGLTGVDLSSLTTVDAQSGMGYAFRGCTGLTGALDLSSLTTISSGTATQSSQGSFYQSFYNCTGLTSVDLSSLTTVDAYTLYHTFYGCTGLTSVNLSSLETVKGSQSMYGTFSTCTNLASINFSNLTTVGTNSSTVDCGQFTQSFRGCVNLTSITFPKLEKIYCTGSNSSGNGSFEGNNTIEKMYFPKLNTITYGSGASSTNQNACKRIFTGCTSLTELHFAAANQSAIEATAGYSTAWGRGAGNVTIYFDL